MECAKIKQLLSEYIDDTLDVQTKGLVEKHLQTCKDCKEELVSMKAVIEELASLEPVEAPKDFLDKVHERIERRSGFLEMIRRLFVPARIRIPLQFATVAAMAVLVFAIFNLIQTAKKIEEVPSVSKQRSVAKEPMMDSLEPASKEESYKSKAVLKEAVAPQKAGEGKPIELVLLIKTEMPRKADAPSAATGALADEKKAGAIEAKRPVIAEVPEKEVTRLRRSWLEEGEPPPAVPKGESPGSKDEAVLASSHLSGALSRVKNLIALVDGRVISKEFEMKTGRPQYITAEIPAKNYGPFFEELNRLGILQSPDPAIPSKGQTMVQIRIQFMSHK